MMTFCGSRRISMVCLTILLLLVSATITQAVKDSDGDGVPDDSDACPLDAGPASNKGCPSLAPQLADSDSDGTFDFLDACPTEVGISENQGCRLSLQPTQPATATQAIVLPTLPVEGECVAATLHPGGVNIRALPREDSAVIGLLHPADTSRVFASIEIGDKRWLRLEQGWIAGWVARTGGNCASVINMTLGASAPQGLLNQLIFVPLVAHLDGASLPAPQTLCANAPYSVIIQEVENAHAEAEEIAPFAPANECDPTHQPFALSARATTDSGWRLLFPFAPLVAGGSLSNGQDNALSALDSSGLVDDVLGTFHFGDRERSVWGQPFQNSILLIPTRVGKRSVVFVFDGTSSDHPGGANLVDIMSWSLPSGSTQSSDAATPTLIQISCDMLPAAGILDTFEGRNFLFFYFNEASSGYGVCGSGGCFVFASQQGV